MQVDFYLLSEARVASKSTPEDASLILSCQLLEKAYQQGHRVFVWCDNQKDAYALDELLWTFKEESFIPHNLQGEGPEPAPAIQIAYLHPPQGFNDVLLNRSVHVPDFFKRFRRILEIVYPDETAKIQSREHYRLYKKQQAQILTHYLP